jgi:MHS family proline/betaine transporter-like MFS transporter
MPSVESEEAARKLVETQDNNPLLDVDSLPFESSFEIARAEHKGAAREADGDVKRPGLRPR